MAGRGERRRGVLLPVWASESRPAALGQADRAEEGELNNLAVFAGIAKMLRCAFAAPLCIRASCNACLSATLLTSLSTL
jgi:hypothetical protein